jgi:hypothetical protein
MKLKFDTTLNTFNIIATLILGVAALVISINSYRLTQRQTYLIERQNNLDEGQLKLELKNATLELINISSMFRQTEKDYPNIKNCLDGFNEMKNILEGQLKNKLLFENPELSAKWTELLGDINFNIKFFQPGISNNVVIDGAYKKVEEFEQKSSELLGLFK